MPRYRFMLRIYGQLLDQGSWIDLADGRAALEKAHQLADALLNFGDSRVPWAEGELVVESSDGGDPSPCRSSQPSQATRRRPATERRAMPGPGKETAARHPRGA